jgi:hypothetical protein
MVNKALRPRLQQLEPRRARTPQDSQDTQDTPKTLFSTSAYSAAKLFWRGCCDSERSPASRRINFKKTYSPPGRSNPEAGGCGGAGCYSSHSHDEAANCQPEVIGDQLLEAGWAASGGRFFFRLRGRIEHGSG